MRIFARDFLASAMGVAMPMFVAYRILEAWPQIVLEPTIPALTPLHLVYIVPLGLIVIGIRRRQFGLAAGPVAFAALIYGWTYTSLHRQAETIGAFELAPSEKWTAGRLVMPMERGCDRLCIEIAASGKYNVWVPDGDAWQSWNATRGPRCNADEPLRATRLAFSLAGYPGWCAYRKRVSEIVDALFITEYQLTGGEADRGADWPSLGTRLSSSDQPGQGYRSVTAIATAIPDFVGTVHVVSRRSYLRQQEVLVARHVVGVLTSPAERLGLWFAAGPIEVHPGFNRANYYKTILGIKPPRPEIARPPQDITELDRLEEELWRADDARNFPNARQGDDPRASMARQFARKAAMVPAEERSAVRAQTTRLLKSDSALMVMAGLLTLLGERPQDVSFAKQQILALLKSDNPAIVSITIGRVMDGFATTFGDDPDVKQAVIDVAFRDQLFEGNSALNRWNTPYSYHAIYKGYEPEVRARVRDFLVGRDQISDGQCNALLIILGKGGSRQIDQALELVASLPTRTFIPCAASLGRLRALDGKESRRALSTQTIAMVIARGKDMPIPDLDKFWMDLTVSKEDRQTTAPIFLAMLAERRAAAEQANDSEGVAILKSLQDRVQYFVMPETK